MTLIVYSRGYLAADTGSTRNDSRERAHKIKRYDLHNGMLFVAAAGTVTDITSMHYHIAQRVKVINSRKEDLTHLSHTAYPVLQCEGIAVFRYNDTQVKATAPSRYTPDAPFVPDTNAVRSRPRDITTHKPFWFNCWAEDGNNAGNVWVEHETKGFLAVGADSAITAAIAAKHTADFFKVEQSDNPAWIIRNVSEINSACDTKFGVDYVNIITGDIGYED